MYTDQVLHLLTAGVTWGKHSSHIVAVMRFVIAKQLQD